MRNKAFFLTALITFFLVALVGLRLSAEAALPVYTVKQVGGDVALGINKSGHVIGWKIQPDGTLHGFLYNGTSTVDLPPLASHKNSLARDINDDDVVVGSSWNETIDQPGHAVRWKMLNGVPQVQVLGTLDGDNVSEALGINNPGQIVGYSNPSSYLGVHAFLYTDAGGMVDLVPGGLSAYATDINDNGQVTGYGACAFRLTNGVLENLGVPTSPTERYVYSTAFAINNNGWVAGSAISATGNYERIARYKDGVGWQIIGGVGEYNIGWGMNIDGDVVGEGVAAVGKPLTGVLYTDEIGALVDLNDLIDPSSGWFVAGAIDINDYGQIAAWGWNTITGEGGALLLSQAGTLLPPAAPSNLVAKTLSGTEIKLTWTDNSNNESGFKIERRKSGDANFTLIFTAAASSTSFIDSGLLPGTTYEYRVKAFNLAGDSQYSTASATTYVPDTVPPTLNFVSPTNGSTVSGTVNVKIEASDNVGVTSLRFYVDEALTCTSSTSPLTCKWNTSKIAKGWHQLKAIAADAAGNVGQQYIDVYK